MAAYERIIEEEYARRHWPWIYMTEAQLLRRFESSLELVNTTVADDGDRLIPRKIVVLMLPRDLSGPHIEALLRKHARDPNEDEKGALPFACQVVRDDARRYLRSIFESGDLTWSDYEQRWVVSDILAIEAAAYGRR